MRKRFGILIALLFMALASMAQNKIYIWSEIEPGWKIRAVDYWTNVKGYGKSVPAKMSELIEEYITLAENTLDLTLKERFLNSDLSRTPVFTSTPQTERLNKGDLYLDIQCRIMETSKVYPNYRSRKLNIEPIIEYKVALYNAAGQVVDKNESFDKIDYKNRIRPLVRGMSDHRRDIEIIKNSFLFSLSGQTISKLIARVEEQLEGMAGKEQKADSEKFRQIIDVLFENRRILYPGEYQDSLLSSKQSPIISPQEDYLKQGDSNIDDDLGTLVESGHYYALLIGINEYDNQSVNDLEEPISDAQRLYSVLLKDYIFEEEYCTLLSNPSREQIIESLDNLTRIVTAKDKLLIFYAGHGLWDNQLGKGFWLPSDASAGNRTNWFSNTELRDYIGGIKSLHTLLISDACFSGGIFKTHEPFLNPTRAAIELYRHRSRKAMTSGSMTMVPDKSVFIEFLVKRLQENTNYSLSSEQLFDSFKTAVINNSATKQTPRYGEIHECGDEGGDFLFIRKNTNLFK